MAKTTYRTWTDAEEITAAMLNVQLRDNGNAIWVGTTAGDLEYYSSATAKTRIPIGAAGNILQSDGTKPVWADAEGCRVRDSSSQSINDNTLTAISSFSTETFDTDGFHTGTDGNITIPAGFGGLYVIGAYGYFAANATANKWRHLEVLVGATIIAAQDTSNGGNDAMYLTLETVYVLAAGDVITMKVQQTSGGALYFTTPALWVARVR
jgi:hypothetical protein